MGYPKHYVADELDRGWVKQQKESVCGIQGNTIMIYCSNSCISSQAILLLSEP